MNCPHCGTEVDEHEATRCLDAWVAQIATGESLEHLPVVYEEGTTRDGTDGWSTFVCPKCRNPEEVLVSEPCCQYYSTSIKAAWEVVEKLGADVTHDIGVHYNGFQWFCEWGKEGEMHIETALSAPLAICRAAIKAVIIKEHAR